MLQYFLDVQRRCGADVSTMDTDTRHASSLLPHPCLPDHQPAPGSQGVGKVGG
ncbi:Uncharacterised protein [Actinomyces viscosus]|uniref:Uncharacterized protein n=1 Tax=Actinomyces viscosus TaxID=1656 RepID=A0A3S4Z9L4_ACTVI|nr:Uncharacterised protein [Actinomyces viscosus]